MRVSPRISAAADRWLGAGWLRFEHAVLALIASSAISKPLVNAALVVAGVLFARDWAAGRRRPVPTPLDAPILAWALVSVLAGVTSIEPLRSFRDLRNLFHWSAFYAVAWAAATSERPVRLQDVWLGAGLLCVAQALLQLAFDFDLQGRERSVPSGFFGGHLELGHFMVLLLALAVPRLAASRDGKQRGVLLATVLAFGAALVTSGGRGPWLAFAVLVIVWTVIERRFVALFVLVLAIFFQIAFLAGREHGLESFYRSYVTLEAGTPDVANSKVASNRWRISMWREGLQRFSLRPVTGTGVETTGDLSQDFRTPFPDLAVAHLHSNYFEILMTRGFFGLAAFAWLMLAATRWLLDEIRRQPPGPARAAVFVGLGAVVAHLVHGLTQFTFGASWIQMGFFVALGLAAGETLRRRAERAEEPAREITTPALTWAIATVAACVVAAPWLLRHRGLATIVAVLAALDIGSRLATASADTVDAALGATFAFVIASSVVLLLAWPGFEHTAVEAMLGASAPFAVGVASLRLRGLAGTRAS